MRKKETFKKSVIVSFSSKKPIDLHSFSVPLRYLKIELHAKKLMIKTRDFHMNLDLFPTI